MKLASFQEENKHLSKQNQHLEKQLTTKEEKMEELVKKVEEVKEVTVQLEKEKADLINKVCTCAHYVRTSANNYSAKSTNMCMYSMANTPPTVRTYMCMYHQLLHQ